MRSVGLDRGSQGLASAWNIGVQRVFDSLIVDFDVVAVLNIRSYWPLRDIPWHENLFPNFLFDETDVSKPLVEQD